MRTIGNCRTSITRTLLSLCVAPACEDKEREQRERIEINRMSRIAKMSTLNKEAARMNGEKMELSERLVVEDC